MARRELSIRARLTLFFVLSVTVVLVFTGVALVNLVHRSLVTSANDQVQGAIVATQDYLAHTTLPSSKVALPIHGDVVVQVTNAAGTTVWAASSPIVEAPVLAVAYGVNSAISDYRLRIAAVVRDYGMTERAQVPADSRSAHDMAQG